MSVADVERLVREADAAVSEVECDDDDEDEDDALMSEIQNTISKLDSAIDAILAALDSRRNGQEGKEEKK